MTRSELMAVMTGGFATVAGGVLAAYVGMLVAYFPDIAGHSHGRVGHVGSGGAGVREAAATRRRGAADRGSLDIVVERPDANVIDAAARGASEGLGLALNVGAMLLAFIALIQLLNALLGWSWGLVGLEGMTLEGILGAIMAPRRVAHGGALGRRRGRRRTHGREDGAERVRRVSSVVVDTRRRLSPSAAVGRSSPPTPCRGFANFSSIAIQVGGIGGIAPGRRSDLSRLGLRAMIGGSIAAFMTATVAGMLV